MCSKHCGSTHRCEICPNQSLLSFPEKKNDVINRINSVRVTHQIQSKAFGTKMKIYELGTSHIHVGEGQPLNFDARATSD